MTEQRRYVWGFREAPQRLGRLLREYQAQDALAPVTVVAPTPYANIYLRRELGRRGMANVRFMPLPRLAELLGAPSLVAQELRPLTALIESAAIRREAGKSTFPFREHPSFHAGLRDTFRDLRSVDESALSAMADMGGTQSELARLYARFHEFTDTYYDAGKLARAAAEAIREGASSALIDLGRVVVYLLDDPGPEHQALFRALAEAEGFAFVFGATGDSDVDAAARETASAYGISLAEPRPDDAPPEGLATAAEGGSRILIAADAREEVRWVARSIAAEARAGARFDAMAVLHWRREPYATLLREQFRLSGIPMTGPDPTRLASTPVGRAARGLADLASGEFRRRDVMRWLTGAPVKLPPSAIPAHWDEASRGAGVVGGREEWLNRLAHYARRQERSADDDVGKLPDAELETMRNAAEDARSLRAFMRALMDDLAGRPADGAPWPAFVTWFKGLVDKYVNDKLPDEAERQQFDILRSDLDDVNALDDVSEAATLAEFRVVLIELLSATVGRLGKFGEGVYVGAVESAIGLQFDTLYLVGMVEGSAPPPKRYDPLLPEREREEAGIPPLPDAAAKNHRALLAAMASSRSRVLSFPRGDNVGGRPQHPSPWLLDEATRLNGGERVLVESLKPGGAQLAQLRRLPWLDVVESTRSGLASVDRLEPADLHDRDLASLLRWSELGRSLSSHHLSTESESLQRAAEMEESRSSRVLTRWDGDISATTRAAAGGVGSPTGLERWAACPYRYFLHDGLDLRQADDPEEIESISPMDRGSLIHNILEAFMREAQADGSMPRVEEAWSEEHRRSLRGIAEAHFAEIERQGLGGREFLWSLARDEIMIDLERFLIEDAKMRATHGVAPYVFEHQFGRSRNRGGDQEFAPEVEFPVPGRDATLKFHGFIDRIDVSPDGRRALVLDYKTGSNAAYRLDDDPVARGTKMQLPVYGLAARDALGADVEILTAYWFVSSKGKFEMRPKAPAPLGESLRRFGAVARTITDGIESGLFPANPGDENKNCGFCDFDRLCSARRVRLWERKQSDPRIREYAALARGEDVDG